MKYLVFLSLLVLLASCSVTTRLNKIADKHPNTFAKVAAKEFPTTIIKDTIIETKIDSADYKALQVFVGEITTTYNEELDSLKKLLPIETKEDCKPYLGIIELQKSEIKDLVFHLKNVQPIRIEKKVIRQVENTAKVELLSNNIRNLLQLEFKQHELNKNLASENDILNKELKTMKHKKQKWKIFFWGSWLLFLAASIIFNKIKNTL